MWDQLLTSLVTVATAIVGVAILAVLVSKNSNTTGVVTAAGTAFATSLNSALGPVMNNGGGFSNSFSGGGVSPITY